MIFFPELFPSTLSTEYPLLLAFIILLLPQTSIILLWTLFLKLGISCLLGYLLHPRFEINTNNANSTAYQGLVPDPDFVLRIAIRLLRQSLREIDAGSLEANHTAKMKFIEDLRNRTTIAEVTEKANEQYYEVLCSELLSPLELF